MECFLEDKQNNSNLGQNVPLRRTDLVIKSVASLDTRFIRLKEASKAKSESGSDQYQDPDPVSTSLDPGSETGSGSREI